MRLNCPQADLELFGQFLNELTQVASKPLGFTGRPCPHCAIPCSHCASTQCTCNCHPECEQAPVQLSIEGATMPVEPKISPLVFSLASLKIYIPYWSCEGHYTGDGKWLRYPQVWFHCRSLVYVRLLHDWLSRQYVAKHIRVPWEVSLTHAGETIDTGFCLQPDIKFQPDTALSVLQHDALVLGKTLTPGLISQASELVTEYACFKT